MSNASTLTKSQQRIVNAIVGKMSPGSGYTQIPSDELIVVGGAALQMYGIKRTTDIDVVVTPEQMQLVIDEPVFKNRAGRKHRSIDHIGVLMRAVGNHEGQLIRPSEYGSTYGDITYMMAPNDHLYQATFEELRDEAVEIGGILVSPPERILAWKRGVNRPKDVKDIALIEKYLAGLSV